MRHNNISNEKEKKQPAIGGIGQWATLGGAKTTKHSDVQDTNSLDVQKPKRIRQTVYLEKENDDYIRDSINAARRKTGKRVEISDMVNEALRRMREH